MDRSRESQIKRETVTVFLLVVLGHVLMPHHNNQGEINNIYTKSKKNSHFLRK